MAWIGQPLRRIEDRRLVSGGGRNVADLRLPGMLEMAVWRSPVAHALIRSASGPAYFARDFPEMAVTDQHRVYDGITERTGLFLRPSRQPAPARERVRHVGEAVAAVVAPTRYEAEDLLERVRVELEPLPAAASVEAAEAEAAPLLHPDWGDNVAFRFSQRRGDAAAALRSAPVVVRGAFRVQRYVGSPMETRACVADFDPRTGELNVWSTTQNPHSMRDGVARNLGLAPSSVRVRCLDTGGGFGPKTILYPEDLMACALAVRLGRPVRWVEDRREHFSATAHARQQVHEAALAATEDGRLLALVDRFAVDLGAYHPSIYNVAFNTMVHMALPYRLPHFDCEARGVVTNKVPVTAYRGAGRSEAAWVMDRLLDRLAARLGLDPVELRRRNLVRPEDMPYETGLIYKDGVPAVLDGGDYPALLDRAVEAIREEAAGQAVPAGRRRGVGVSLYVEGSAQGPYEGARVRVEPTGEVFAWVGSASQGQGHETVFAQIVADLLQVDPGRVRVAGGDTAGVPHGVGTFGSRSIVNAGNALGLCAEEIRTKAFQLAARRLEARAEDLELRPPGVVGVRGVPERSVALAQLAREAAPGEDLEATGYFRPPTVTFSAGCHAAACDVDPETGEVRVAAYAVAEDCGRVVNPLLAGGQAVGGTVQGLGGALLEEVVYDADGQILTATFMDYLLPTAAEAPRVRLLHAATPSERNPLGFRGMGEGGAIPPPAAVAAAVEAAVGAPAGSSAATPLTPERVVALAGTLSAEAVS